MTKTDLATLKKGTTLVLRDGRKVVFHEAKRTKFVGEENGTKYLYPIAAITRVDGTVKQTDVMKKAEQAKAAMRNLKKGDVIVINHKGNAVLLRFEKKAKTYYQATSVLENVRIRFTEDVFVSKLKEFQA